MSGFHTDAADLSNRDKDLYLLDEDGQIWQRYRDDISRDAICCDQLHEHLCSDVYMRYDKAENFVYLLGRNPSVDGLSYCPFCGTKMPAG